ncbi:MAG: ATP-binding protein [bacterium]
MKIKYVKVSFFSILLLLFLLLLVGILGRYAWRDIQNQNTINLEDRSKAIAKIIEIRLSRDSYLLYSLRGLYAANENVSSEQFSSFGDGAQLTEKFPGIYGIEFIERASVENSNSFFVKYFYPNNSERYVPDVNYLNDPKIKEALSESLNNNKLTMANGVRVAGSDDLNDNSIIYLPIYKNGFPVSTVNERNETLSGFVGVVIESKVFFDSIVHSEEIDWNNLDLYIYSDKASLSADYGNDNFLYDVDNENFDKNKAEVVSSFDLPLNIANKQWLLHFVTEFSTKPNSPENIVMIGLILFGVFFSFAVSISFYILGTSRGRAVDLARDMTSNLRKQKIKSDELARDLEKFQLAVSEAFDHIIITDADGIILYMNKAAEKITGFSSKEVLGKKAGSKELWGGRMDSIFYQNMWKTIKQDKKVFAGEITNVRKDGQEYQAMGSISPIMGDNGAVKFFVGIERDTTKEKEIDRMKSEFVSVASHQLRTPLTGIKWFTELLLENKKEKLSKEQQDYVEEIYESNNRLIALVNDLLNVSRIDSGKNFEVEKKNIDVVGVVNEVVNEQIGLAKEKGIRVVMDGDISKEMQLNIDSVKIKQVFQNLISNAVKYSKENSEVVFGRKDGIDDVTFFVKDSGLGIPPEQQDRIFEKFFRASNVLMTGAEGTGLGLYIAKSIVESHGGKIWFESSEGNGTTFFVKIPKK